MSNSRAEWLVATSKIANEPTEPTSAQDLIDELAPRVSEVVHELRHLAGYVPPHLPGFSAVLNNIIDKLAQVATILTLASATGDVSADHWRKVDGDKLNRALEDKQFREPEASSHSAGDCEN